MLFFIMPKISFFVRKSKESNVLYCRVSFNGISSEFSTSEKVDLKNWSQDLQRHKIKNSIVNTLIESLTFKLNSNAVLQNYLKPIDLIESLQTKKEEKPILLVEIIENFEILFKGKNYKYLFCGQL